MSLSALASPEAAGLEPSRLPRHVAVIMDGNGRWAKARHLPRIAGHRSGVEAVRATVRACGELGIEVLTLYAFSTENWARPRAEVRELMRLLCWALRAEALELDKSNVRLRVSGRLSELSIEVRSELSRAVESLKDNTGLILNLALNYGGRQELVDAVNALLREEAREISEKDISRHLYSAGLPDPDLVIRTSGELRLSNFLLWQLAYAEFYVTPTLWPDFRKPDLLKALAAYQGRQRRFGGV